MNETEFAELVQERPDLARYFMFMPAGRDGRRAYYRRIPRTYKDRQARPPGQLRIQIALGESSHSSFGARGFKDGVPVVAAINRDRLKGRRFRKLKWREIMEQLTEGLREVGKVVEEKARV